ncbi:hypothetical protein [Streptomyces sp. NPDC001221]
MARAETGRDRGSSGCAWYSGTAERAGVCTVTSRETTATPRVFALITIGQSNPPGTDTRNVSVVGSDGALRAAASARS